MWVYTYIIKQNTNRPQGKEERKMLLKEALYERKEWKAESVFVEDCPDNWEEILEALNKEVMNVISDYCEDRLAESETPDDEDNINELLIRLWDDYCAEILDTVPAPVYEEQERKERELRETLNARAEELRKHGCFTAKDDDGKAMVEYILLQDAYIEGTNEDPYFTALAICPEDDFDEYGWIPVYEITWYALDEWLEGDRSDEGLACDWEHPDDIQRLKVYYDPKDGTWI